jgi:hypothetical protein
MRISLTTSEPVCRYRRERTPQELRAYDRWQQTDPAVVAKLRAGIAEFREMLNARDRWADGRH